MTPQIDTNQPEFQSALSLIRFTNHSVFLTGKAGTGKSTFLRYVCSQVKKNHVVLAPTGIAAINAGGCTLHSFFKLPFYPLLPDDPKFASSHIRDFLKYNKQHIRLLQRVELIIIDEISMVRADIIDFIDRVLRIYCHNMRQPFGGKQMLLVGDVFQLEPVVKSDERQILSKFYPNAHFFSAHVFQEMQLVSIELTKVYRQTDRAFIATLDRIRSGTASDTELRLLNTRHTPNAVTTPQGELNIVLATRRDNVDHINSTELERLEGEPITLEGAVKGEFPAASLPTLMHLEVKEGAQIIFVKNDPEHRWVNGTLGTIHRIDQEQHTVYVDTETHANLEVKPERWSNVRYTYNELEKRIEEDELGTFTQFPFRLAWAITIHKSQGLTFTHATIDFGGGTFTSGQAYVALSRCTSLEGLTLSRPVARSDIFVSPHIVRFAQQFNDQQLIHTALSTARADTEYRAANQAFEQGNMEACLSHFITAMHARYDVEKPHVRRLIQRKLGTINTLHSRLNDLQTENHTLRQQMKKFAREYYLMGNECMAQGCHTKAAIANYRKALELYPLYPDALTQLSVALMHQGEHRQALDHLTQATELAPTLFKAQYQRGRALVALDLYDEAISALSHATSIKPHHPAAHQLLGDCYDALGNKDQAQILWALAEKLRQKK